MDEWEYFIVLPYNLVTLKLKRFSKKMCTTGGLTAISRTSDIPNECDVGHNTVQIPKSEFVLTYIFYSYILRI